MNLNYEEVPAILSGKDLDYLSDMFQWNYGALKSANSAIENVEDEEMLEVFGRAINLFDDNINIVLDTIRELGGISNE